DAVLAKVSALAPIRATLSRYRLGESLKDLGAQQRALAPSAFISFSCYIEDQPTPPQSHAFILDGQRFSAEEIHVARGATQPALYADRYDAISRLLVRGFHYGALLSEAGLK